MMATVPQVTSGLGLRKFQADGFLLTGVCNRSSEGLKFDTKNQKYIQVTGPFTKACEIFATLSYSPNLPMFCPYFLYMSHLYFRFPIYKICCICFSFPACTPWLILLDLKRKKHKLLRSNLYRHVTFPLSPSKLSIQSLLSSPQINAFPSGRKTEFYTHNTQHLKTEFCAYF